MRVDMLVVRNVNYGSYHPGKYCEGIGFLVGLPRPEGTS